LVTAEYYLKYHEERKDTIVITKFDGHAEPAAQYEVNMRSGRCNCPAGAHGRNCKHLSMAATYMQNNPR